MFLQTTSHSLKILDAKYKETNLPSIILNCTNLPPTYSWVKSLLNALNKYKGLIDGTFSLWDMPAVHFGIKEEATLYHGKPNPIFQVYVHWNNIEILKKTYEGEWWMGVPVTNHSNATWINTIPC